MSLALIDLEATDDSHMSNFGGVVVMWGVMVGLLGGGNTDTNTVDL